MSPGSATKRRGSLFGNELLIARACAPSRAHFASCSGTLPFQNATCAIRVKRGQETGSGISETACPVKRAKPGCPRLEVPGVSASGHVQGAEFSSLQELLLKPLLQVRELTRLAQRRVLSIARSEQLNVYTSKTFCRMVLGSLLVCAIMYDHVCTDHLTGFYLFISVAVFVSLLLMLHQVQRLLFSATYA